MKKLLARAIEIAVQAHSGQTDKGGNPYILHPLWVMNKVRHLGPTYMIVAVLHDVVEDTEWTIDRLREEGYPTAILEALKLLDFRGVDYMSRIEEIARVELARQVKMRDIEHNMKVKRLKGLTSRDFSRLRKYATAFTYLEKV